jgi:hypothetical protein
LATTNATTINTTITAAPPTSKRPIGKDFFFFVASTAVTGLDVRLGVVVIGSSDE